MRAFCGALDPASVPLPDAPDVVASLAAMEKLVSGARLRMLARADAAGRWRRGGYRSFAEWMARQAGSSLGAAKSSLETSQRVTDQPITEQALRTGQLSESQANTISDAVEANPGSEDHLVRKARTASGRDLREAAGRAKAKGDPDPAATRRRLHAARSARTFTDAEGLWNLHVRNSPEVGAELQAILQPFLERVFTQARVTGARESHEAYGADAVTDIFRAAHAATSPTSHDPGSAEACVGSTHTDPSPPVDTDTDDHAASADAHTNGGADTGAGPSGPPARFARGSARPDCKLIGVLPWESLVQGHDHTGETCEVAGLGPVSVAALRARLGDAFVALVITKGQDIRHVVHLGRQVTAHQRTALEARGYRCAVTGCGCTWNLEIDHVTDWYLTQRTRLDDLAWLCGHHHDQKTHRGYRLSGPPGRRRWHHPGGTIDEPDQNASPARGQGDEPATRPATAGPDAPNQTLFTAEAPPAA